MRAIISAAVLFCAALSCAQIAHARQEPKVPTMKPADQNNSSLPGAGGNNFSESEAQARIEAWGYTNVTGLRKDPAGLWRAEAFLGGEPRHVALNSQGQVN